MNNCYNQYPSFLDAVHEPVTVHKPLPDTFITEFRYHPADFWEVCKTPGH